MTHDWNIPRVSLALIRGLFTGTCFPGIDTMAIDEEGSRMPGSPGTAGVDGLVGC